MQAISTEFSKALLDNSTLLVKAKLTLKDGTVKELTGDDIVSLSYEQATSSDSSFDVGAAIIGKCDITLNNHDRRFDEYDFTGATIVPYVGKELSSGTEWLRKGTYTVDQPDSYSGTIAISCLDNLSKLEAEFSTITTVAYPTTASDMFKDIVRGCGLTLAASTFEPAYDPTIRRSPSQSSLTCLQVIADLAQLMCGWVRCNMYGEVVLSWYDQSAIEAESWLNGGDFSGSKTPYATGDKADGGTFSDYTSGTSYDGGSLANNSGVGHIYRPKTVTVSTDDVVITGVSVKEQNEIKVGDDGKETNGADGSTCLAGTEGYVLSLTSNRLVEYGTGSDCAKALLKRLGGLRVRPFTATAPTDPSIEAGDPVIVSDYTGAMHTSYVTSLKVQANNSETFKCSAKSASRNSVSSATAVTQAIIAARNDIKRERNARELAQAALDTRIGEASGLYHTEETLSDGSKVYYLHDKPTLGASRIIWKMNSGAVAVSTDGGKTYSTGITAEGDSLMNRIYAKGINADYINAGTYTVKDSSGNPMLKIGSNVDGYISLLNPATKTDWVSAQRTMFAQAQVLNLEWNTTFGGKVSSSAKDYEISYFTKVAKFNSGSSTSFLIMVPVRCLCRTSSFDGADDVITPSSGNSMASSTVAVDLAIQVDPMKSDGSFDGVGGIHMNFPDAIIKTNYAIECPYTDEDGIKSTVVNVVGSDGLSDRGYTMTVYTAVVRTNKYREFAKFSDYGVSMEVTYKFFNKNFTSSVESWIDVLIEDSPVIVIPM